MSSVTDEDEKPLIPQPDSLRLMTQIFLQDACLQHRFIRSRDTSNIVERPERLRAVKIGLAAAIARLEELTESNNSSTGADALADAIERMQISGTTNDKERLDAQINVASGVPIRVVQSSASVDLLNHAAVKHIHGDVDGDVYLDKLKNLIKTSAEKIAKGDSEIPDGLSQGDLYRMLFISRSYADLKNAVFSLSYVTRSDSRCARNRL
jgi:histone deacetylase HOS3